MVYIKNPHTFPTQLRHLSAPALLISSLARPLSHPILSQDCFEANLGHHIISSVTLHYVSSGGQYSSVKHNHDT